MHRIIASHHPVRHAKSFKYAFEGVLHALLNEANFRVELVIASFFISVGLIMHFSLDQWALIVLAIGFLLCSEIMNTVIEEFTDLLIKEYNPKVKIIKDLSAAFVLTASLTCLFVFILVVWGHVFF